MKELDRASQEKLFISAYWPQRTNDELHVGYGVAKGFLVYQSVSIIFLLVSRFFGLFFEPKFRSTNPLLRFVPMTVIGILLSIQVGRNRKLSGFYQLDAQGTPTFFIGTFPPESTRGHIGVSRKKFLNTSL